MKNISFLTLALLVLILNTAKAEEFLVPQKITIDKDKAVQDATLLTEAAEIYVANNYKCVQACKNRLKKFVKTFVRTVNKNKIDDADVTLSLLSFYLSLANELNAEISEEMGYLFSSEDEFRDYSSALMNQLENRGNGFWKKLGIATIVVGVVVASALTGGIAGAVVYTLTVTLTTVSSGLVIAGASALAAGVTGGVIANYTVVKNHDSGILEPDLVDEVIRSHEADQGVTIELR